MYVAFKQIVIPSFYGAPKYNLHHSHVDLFYFVEDNMDACAPSSKLLAKGFLKLLLMYHDLPLP